MGDVGWPSTRQVNLAADLGLEASQGLPGERLGEGVGIREVRQPNHGRCAGAGAGRDARAARLAGACSAVGRWVRARAGRLRSTGWPATFGLVCVRIDPQAFALFDAARAPRDPVPDVEAWAEESSEVAMESWGTLFNWASMSFVAVPAVARPAVAGLVRAGLPADLLAWALPGWEWALLVCLLNPTPELAELLPPVRYHHGYGLCLPDTYTPWLPAAVGILAAVAT